MIRYLIFLYLFFSFAYTSFAQESNFSNEYMQLKINAFQPSVEYEMRVLRTSTINLKAQLGIGFLPIENNFTRETKWHYLILPILDTQYRYYYNLDRRAAKGKLIEGNSGNFIGWRVAGTTAPLADDLPVFVGAHFVTGPFWGLQRTYPNNFSIGFNIGVAYFINEFKSQFISPLSEVTIGYRIFSKKK